MENPEHVSHGVVSLELDGVSLTSKWIPLADDGGNHQVRVRLGRRLEEDGAESGDAQGRERMSSTPIAR